MGCAKNTKNTGHSFHLHADALHCTSSLGRRASAATVMARRGISGLWESKGIHIYMYCIQNTHSCVTSPFSPSQELTSLAPSQLGLSLPQVLRPGLVVLRSRAGGFVHRCQ